MVCTYFRIAGHVYPAKKSCPTGIATEVELVPFWFYDMICSHGMLSIKVLCQMFLLFLLHFSEIHPSLPYDLCYSREEHPV